MSSRYILYPRSQLFIGWITLSTGYIAIQRISVDKTNRAIHWIVIYPVDSIIHLSYNSGQISNSTSTALRQRYVCMPCLGFYGLFKPLHALFCADLDPCQKIVCYYRATCQVFAPDDGRCVCHEFPPAYEDEVCSDDGVTYQNFGSLQQESCSEQKFIGVKKNTSCERK